MKIRALVKILLGTLLVQGTAATCQPVFREEAASGSGTASQGVSTPAIITRPSSSVPDFKFDCGKPTKEEIEALSKRAVKIGPRQVIKEFVTKLAKQPGMPFLQGGQLTYLSKSSLENAFPDKLFYVLRFRQWPIGFELPPPLAPNNIMVFTKNRDFTLINSESLQQAFFRNQIKNVKTKAQAKELLTAWLLLAQELNQDGMYSFAAPVVSTDTANGILKASGKLEVLPHAGDMGKISATITFDKNGQLMRINQELTLNSGMRPICQSTKLLDKDPIVAKMAQKDLLLMGQACKEYLDSQRAKASPELQQAIDKIWQQILKEGR